MALPMATRPASWDGCMATWSEEDQEMVIRTQMTDGSVKVRRAYTGVIRYATASANLKAAQVADIMTLWRVDMQQGVRGVLLKEPDGTESAWRFTKAPRVQWIERQVANVSFELERHRGWP